MILGARWRCIGLERLNHRSTRSYRTPAERHVLMLPIGERAVRLGAHPLTEERAVRLSARLLQVRRSTELLVETAQRRSERVECEREAASRHWDQREWRGRVRELAGAEVDLAEQAAQLELGRDRRALGVPERELRNWRIGVMDHIPLRELIRRVATCGLLEVNDAGDTASAAHSRGGSVWFQRMRDRCVRTYATPW